MCRACLPDRCSSRWQAMCSAVEFFSHLRAHAGAGLAFKGNAFGAEEAQQTLDVNFFGTRRATEALLPLMSGDGSIVNVCRCVS